METTGLDTDTNLILEIVMVVTDRDLNEIDSMRLVLHHPHPDVGGRYDTSRITSSQPFFERTLGSNGAFIGNIVDSSESAPGSGSYYHHPYHHHQQHRHPRRSNYKKCLLAGSTVYFDRIFLLKYFPCLKTFFHYRVVDVSTPLEMVRRWRPDIVTKLPRRNGTHRAYDDILDSIELMRFFKDTFLKKVDGSC
ncbi:unnamed protein product [Ectocarpus sp. 12 AP-2014]